VLLRDDEAEQSQIAQSLNELRGLLGLAVPAFEVLMPGAQELVDGIHHHSEHFAVLFAQSGIGKERILEDPSRHEIFRNAHLQHLFGDAIDHQIAHSVVAHIIGEFAVQIPRRRHGLPAEGHSRGNG
jgi:hypothetical protein